MKKLSLVLCIVLMMSLFIGCGSDSDTSSQGGNDVSDSIFSTDTVNFVANGEAVYDVVRPEAGNKTAVELATLLFQQYRNKLGVKAKNVSDSNDGADKYEILIGNTNRTESTKALEWLKTQNEHGGRTDNYIICTIGKKIVIQGNSQDALVNAVNYFIDNYLSKSTVSGGIKYVYLVNGEFTEININNAVIGGFAIVRPHYNSSYLTYAEVEKLVDMSYKKTGYKPVINDDTVTDEVEYEIIVGDCARPNVTKIENRDEYSVKISGKKVYINGGSHQATTVAVTEFIKKCESKSALTDADSFSGSYSQTVSSYNSATYYTPKFYDDFDDITGEHVNANGLDTTKWKLTTSSTASFDGYKAKRATDPEHIFVADGMFQIHPYVNEDKKEIYGGFLETHNLMRFTYGYIEYSARMPEGPGFWTALWLRCGDYSGPARPEIDIAESFGNSKTYAFNMHTWPGIEAEQFGVTHTSLDGGKYPDKKKTCPDDKKFNDDFHTFGMLWTPEIVYATCDGVPYFKYNMGDKNTDAGCFGKLMKICISMACGFENCPGGGNPFTASEEVWNDTGKYYVDWVYVYQLDDGIQTMVFNDTTW